MATRENQGLQAIIIVLTILTIGLLVGVLLVNNARKTQRARADNAEQQRTAAQTAQSQAQAEASQYKEFMGFDANDSVDSVRAAVEADMTAMALTTPPESRQYHPVLAALFEENRKLVLNAAAATEEVKQLKERLLAVEAQKETQVAEFRKEMEKIRADAAAEREKFETQYARINGEKDGIQKQMDEMRTAHEAASTALETERTQLQNQIAKLEQSIDKLRQGVPNPDQFAQPADGEIRWVDQRSGTVWVNIGSADGLRPQVTFAVAEAGTRDAAQSEQKGSIEITRIDGPHMAEAHITSDTATNPLLPGDRIFSQVWDRGRQVGIGIAGFVDMDDDRQSDLDKLKAIITANGGVVDAAPDAAGKLQGALKVSTRYLVLGDYPNDARMTDLRESWNNLSEQAEQLGVETVSLNEFLSLMGWRNEARSVSMGPGARAEDFPAEAREQELPRRTGQPRGAFEPRLPSTSY